MSNNVISSYDLISNLSLKQFENSSVTIIGGGYMGQEYAKVLEKLNVSNVTIITNSKKIAEYVKAARSHGLTRSLADRYSKGKPWDYDIEEPGFNFRLDEIRSSLGLNQIKRLEQLNKLRKKASDYYNKKLSDQMDFVRQTKWYRTFNPIYSNRNSITPTDSTNHI